MSIKSGNKWFFPNHIVHILPYQFVLKKKQNKPKKKNKTNQKKNNLSLSVQSPEPSGSCVFLHSVQSYNTAICGRIGL